MEEKKEAVPAISTSSTPTPAPSSSVPRSTTEEQEQQQQAQQQGVHVNDATRTATAREVHVAANTPLTHVTKPPPPDPLLTGLAALQRRPPPQLQHQQQQHLRIYSTGSSDDDDNSLYSEDSIVGDYEMSHQQQRQQQHEQYQQPNGSSNNNNNNNNSQAQEQQQQPIDEFLTAKDLEIYQRLDEEYERALEERDVTYHARYNSVRQTACFSVVFMALLLTASTVFFLKQTEDWDTADALLFSVYSITTVGYGHLHNPDTPAFQLYTVFFILVGIATLTIMVAQVYQCLALEASRAQQSRDHTVSQTEGHLLAQIANATTQNSWMAQHHRYHTQQQQQQQGIVSGTASVSSPAQHNPQQQQHPASPISSSSSPTSSSHHHQQQEHPHNNNVVVQIGDFLHVPTDWMDRMFVYLERLHVFLKENEIGRGISVLFPFVGLILIGAMVIGPLEGWTAVEALYFSVVSLTTVGFGDYYPTQTASIWFAVLWLPFSVGFMSLYLSNVAAFYIRLSDKNIVRIEKQLRRRLRVLKRKLEQEQQAARRRAMRGQQQQPHGGINHTDDGNNGGDRNVGDDEEGAYANSSNHSGGIDDEVNHSDENGSVPMHSLPLPEEIIGAESHRARKSKDDNGNDVDDVVEGPVDHRRRAASKFQRSGFDSVPLSEDSNSQRRSSTRSRVLFGATGSAENRRERILRANQLGDDSSGRGGDTSNMKGRSSGGSTATMTSMRDVLRTVHFNLVNNTTSMRSFATNERESDSVRVSEVFSIHSFETVHESFQSDRRVVRKPSFALRALVQERLAEIIATDVAGYQDSIEIKDHTLSVTISSLKQTADRWKIPRRARKAFRAVAFEVLFFVGEYGLVTRGADALYDLSPLVFHGLFAPVLAALGDAEMMESWLARTQVLAEVDLGKTYISRNLVSQDSIESDDPLRAHRPSFDDRKAFAHQTKKNSFPVVHVGTGSTSKPK